MRNSWLVFLFILLLAAMVLSFFIIRQSQQVIPQPGLEAPQLTAPDQGWTVPASAPRLTPASQAKLPTTKRAITIISLPPAAVPEARIPEASGGKDKFTDSFSGVNAGYIPAENTQLAPAGITKNSKQPPAQEAKEMNSRGIILY